MTNSSQTPPSLTTLHRVELGSEEWQTVLNLVIEGVKAAGPDAFIPGGALLQSIREQVNKSIERKTNARNARVDTGME